MNAVNPKRRAVAIAVAGTAVGATGLGVLAVPAGAGEAPELPPVQAQELVESVLASQPPALSGTVAMKNDLGLPDLGSVPVLSAESGRVFYDGENRVRLALEKPDGDYTLVSDGSQVWTHDWAAGEVTHSELPEELERADPAQAAHLPADPAALSGQLLEFAQETSTVTVDGTATVADRAAYELVLTPKPTEKTLLRELRVAVDAETRTPLRFSVHTHGTAEPAAEFGFTEIDFGDQPENLFSFSPPPNASVTELEPQGNHGGQRVEQQLAESRTVGEGWDTVLLARIPEQARSGLERGAGAELLSRVGTEVSGEYGSGHLIETRAATALLTEDGWLAVGAVPEPVLAEALAARGER